jgi:hypothetical protein
MLFLDSYIVGGNAIKAYISYPNDTSLAIIDSSVVTTSSSTSSNNNASNNIYNAYNIDNIVQKQKIVEEVIIVAKLDALPTVRIKLY